MSFLDLIKNLGQGVQESGAAFRRNVQAPIRRGVQGAVEAINPWDDESRGNRLIDQSAREYGFTPEFKKTVGDTNPYVTAGNWQKAEALGENRTADGLYYPREGYSQMNSRLRVSPTAFNPKNVLFHEGLHSAWDSSPDRRQSFIGAYNQSATPELRAYLVNRTQPYKSSQQAHARGFMDINLLPPDLQNEVHSYVPEYYQNVRTPMPDNLKNYYRQYYEPSRTHERQITLNTLRDMLGERY